LPKNGFYFLRVYDPFLAVIDRLIQGTSKR